MRSASAVLLALAASLSTTSAALQGFNYGATKSDGSYNFQSDYQALFSTAKNLVGTSGFTSARLYTMIQGGSSTNEPTSAIPAAIAENTSLLLGLWASGGEGPFQAEITALKSAIQQYGTDFTKLVVGISVGSEDLYRSSPMGIAAKSGYGAEPSDIVRYIGLVRDAIKGTPLSDAPIGHVDTWTAWANSSNSAVAEACDWVGMDAYPYFQSTMSNSIESGASLFNAALQQTKDATAGKPVWITETGWPVSGSTQNLGVPSVENAKKYWDAVGCPNFGKINTWWYTLQDAAPVTPNPSFGIVGSTLSTTPLFDLSCNAVSSSSSSAHSSTATSAASSAATGAAHASVTSAAASSAATSFSTVVTGSHAASSGAAVSPSQGVAVASGSSASSGSSPASATGTASTSISSSISSPYSISSPSSVSGGAGPAANASAIEAPAGASAPVNGSYGAATATPSSPGSSPTAPLTISANGASPLSRSFVLAMGAVLAAFAAL